ncbi:MAG: hypothetical protein GY938_11320 [Ketobacter sp.]|nr:hypothetical protein [Ketobacter sp.]
MGISTVTGLDSTGATKTLIAAENTSGHLAAATVIVDEDGNSIEGGEYITQLGERLAMGVTTTGEDLWPGNDLASAPTSHTTVPTPSASGEQMEWLSESANDTIAGTGIQKVKLEVLRVSGARRTIELDTNGTTPVALPDTDVIFINDMYSSQVGSNNVAAGHGFVRNVATPGLVYDMIAAGGNRSLVPHYMVPVGLKLKLEHWDASEGQGKRVSVRIRADCTPGGVRQAGVFLFKGVAYLNKSTQPTEMFDTIPAFSIVKVSGWPDAGASGSDCATVWSGRLISA